MSQPKLATPRSGYGGRGYRIPGRVDVEGKQIVYPSVTTVLGQVSKPALIQWAADQTAAYAVAHLSQLVTKSEEVGWGYLRFFWSREANLDDLDQLRQHHEKVKNDAAELGTNIHEWIEAEIDGLMPYPELIARESEQMAEQFRLWLNDHEIISHEAEFTVVNDLLGVAGTADADWEICCLHDGPTCLGQRRGEFVRTLLDLKSARHTWREHGMQLALLDSCDVLMREVAEGTEGAIQHERTVKGKRVRDWWIEEDAPTFDRQALLHIRPNDLDSKGDSVPAFCKLIDMSLDMDLHLAGAEGALALARSEFQLKARLHQRGIEETEEEIG